MTVRAQIYHILLTTAEALCAAETYLIAHPDLDPDDELFEECNRAFQAILPSLRRLSAEPELPATVETFLVSLAHRTEETA